MGDVDTERGNDSSLTILSAFLVSLYREILASTEMRSVMVIVGHVFIQNLP